MTSAFERLPSSWHLARVDRVASVNARIGWKALTAAEYQPEGVPFLATPNIKGSEIDFDEVNYIPEWRYEESPELKLRVGDVLLAKDGNTLGIANLVKHLPRPATVNGSIAVIRPRKIDPRFLRYVVASSAIQELIAAVKAGMGVPHLFQWDINRLPVPVPPDAEQRAIADFLDTETVRVDALITKKRRMIDLLGMRAIAASDRLALGLEHDDTVVSRSDFFTVVPRHWEHTTVRHLHCEVQTGPFGSQLHAEEYVEDGWPVVNPANLKQGGIVPLPAMAVTDEKRFELRRHVLCEGDIVFGRRGEMGRAGLVEAQHVGWLCGTGSLRLRLSSRSPLIPAYLKLLLETTALRRYFELTSIGSTMDNLNSEIVLGMPCLVPPKTEQVKIVNTVRARRASVRALVDRLNQQIGLLREHRQATVTAAVSGELAVPGVAA